MVFERWDFIQEEKKNSIESKLYALNIDEWTFLHIVILHQNIVMPHAYYSHSRPFLLYLLLNLSFNFITSIEQTFMQNSRQMIH